MVDGHRKVEGGHRLIPRSKHELEQLRVRARTELTRRLAPAPDPDDAAVGHLDAPCAGETLAPGTFVVRGWVLGGSPASVVVVTIDGTPIGATTPTLRRPDVAAEFGLDEDAALGFAVSLDPTAGEGIAPGPHHLGVATVLQGQQREFGGADIVLVAGTSLGEVDAPTDGATLPADRVGVYGWAVVDGAPASHVLAFADDELLAAFAVSELRPDAAVLAGNARLARCGFWGELDLSAHAPGKVALTFMAITTARGDGARAHDLGSATVQLELPEAPRLGAFLDRPEEGETVDRGVLTIKGWALDPTSPIDVVEVTINGTPTGEARIGIDRPDLLEEFEEIAHAVAGGFEHTIDLRPLVGDDGSVLIEVATISTAGVRETVLRSSHKLTEPKRPTEAQARRRTQRAAVVRERAARTLSALPASRQDGLNLLVITHHLGYGGGQLWLAELLRRARAGSDFPCTVVAPNDGPLRRDLERLGVAVHLHGAWPIDDIESYEGRIAELMVWARLQGCNAALVNTVGCFPGADAALRLGLPCAWAIHESWTPEMYFDIVYPGDLLDPDVRKRADWALAHSDALIFEAEATRELYLGHTSAERARVVHYGVDISHIDKFQKSHDRAAVRARLGFSEDDQVLLVMGTIEPRKAQLLITEAFAAVSASHPSAVLALVGDTDTQYSRMLRQYIEHAGLGDRVQVVKVVQDADSWYFAADLMICASDVESLPRSVLEAMAFGVPILATSVFGLIDILEDGRTGLLIEPRRFTAVVGGLRRALDMPRVDLEAIGKAGQAYAANAFDSSRYARELIALLRELVEGRPEDQDLGR